MLCLECARSHDVLWNFGISVAFQKSGKALAGLREREFVLFSTPHELISSTKRRMIQIKGYLP